MEKWLIIGGAVLVCAIIADKLLARRGARPLSQSRPTLDRPHKTEKALGQEATDVETFNEIVEENEFLETINGEGRRAKHMDLMHSRTLENMRKRN